MRNTSTTTAAVCLSLPGALLMVHFLHSHHFGFWVDVLASLIEVFFMLVVEVCSIVGKLCGIKFGVTDERTLTHALVHNFVRSLDEIVAALLRRNRAWSHSQRIRESFTRKLMAPVEALHVTSCDQLFGVVLEVINLHSRELFLLLYEAYILIVPNRLQLLRKTQLTSQIARVPVARQNVQNSSVSVHYEHLNIVRTRTICRFYRISISGVCARITGVRLIAYVFVAANEIVV